MGCTNQLLLRDGHCIGGELNNEPRMIFAGKGWEMTVEFPEHLRENVMHKIRDYTGKRVRVYVMVEDE